MKKRARQRGYEVLGELRPGEVLPFTGPNAPKKTFFGYGVKMTSLRYQTFWRSPMCECCGLYGTVMLLELPKDRDTPHFNLYAEREGELVQMTKDHIQPKSKGGEDHINNMQTLCCRCNELKGDQIIRGGNRKTLERLRKIQDGVQVVYTVQRQSMHIMEGFATTPKGIAEIVRQYLEEVTLSLDTGELTINVDMETHLVTMAPNDGSPTHTFHIKALRRI